MWLGMRWWVIWLPSDSFHSKSATMVAAKVPVLALAPLHPKHFRFSVPFFFFVCLNGGKTRENFRAARWALSLSEVLETRLFSSDFSLSLSQTQEWKYQRKYFILYSMLCGRSQWLFIDSAFGATRATTALWCTFSYSGCKLRSFK